jgi:hypothetical protein
MTITFGKPKEIKSSELSKQEAVDGLLVLEKLYLTMSQLGASEDTLKTIEKKINKLLDII